MTNALANLTGLPPVTTGSRSFAGNRSGEFEDLLARSTSDDELRSQELGLPGRDPVEAERDADRREDLARTSSDRACEEPTGSERTDSSRSGTDRTDADRPSEQRTGSDRTSTDRAGTDRAGTDRAGTDRADRAAAERTRAQNAASRSHAAAHRARHAHASGAQTSGAAPADPTGPADPTDPTDPARPAASTLADPRPVGLHLPGEVLTAGGSPSGTAVTSVHTAVPVVVLPVVTAVPSGAVPVPGPGPEGAGGEPSAPAAGAPAGAAPGATLPGGGATAGATTPGAANPATAGDPAAVATGTAPGAGAAAPAGTAGSTSMSVPGPRDGQTTDMPRDLPPVTGRHHLTGPLPAPLPDTASVGARGSAAPGATAQALLDAQGAGDPATLAAATAPGSAAPGAAAPGSATPGATTAAPSGAAPGGQAVDAAPPAAVRHVQPALVELSRGLRAGGGTAALVVRLDPPELGQVLVRVVVRGGEVSVSCRSAEQSAVGALQLQQHEVRELLRREGLGLSGFDVRQDTSAGFGTPGGAPDPRGQQSAGAGSTGDGRDRSPSATPLSDQTADERALPGTDTRPDGTWL